MIIKIETKNKSITIVEDEKELDFINLTVEILKTIEKCKNTFTIPNNINSTGISSPFIGGHGTPNTTSYNGKTTSMRSHFQ